MPYNIHWAKQNTSNTSLVNPVLTEKKKPETEVNRKTEFSIDDK